MSSVMRLLLKWQLPNWELIGCFRETQRVLDNWSVRARSLRCDLSASVHDAGGPALLSSVSR